MVAGRGHDATTCRSNAHINPAQIINRAQDHVVVGGYHLIGYGIAVAVQVNGIAVNVRNRIVAVDPPLELINVKQPLGDAAAVGHESSVLMSSGMLSSTCCC